MTWALILLAFAIALGFPVWLVLRFEEPSSSPRVFPELEPPPGPLAPVYDITAAVERRRRRQTP